MLNPGLVGFFPQYRVDYESFDTTSLSVPINLTLVAKIDLSAITSNKNGFEAIIIGLR